MLPTDASSPSSALEAIILAAGSGVRLRPVTDDRPKCLVEVGNTTIFARLIKQLHQAGVRRATVITGYRSDAIAAHLKSEPAPIEVQLVFNPIYETTNNAMSLLFGLKSEFLADSESGIVLCDGDVVMREGLLSSLINDPSENALLVEQRSDMGDEEMKAMVDREGKVLKLAKTLEPKKCFGESIGIQKVGPSTIPKLLKAIEWLMDAGHQNVYYEEAFQQLIDQNEYFKAIAVSSQDWTEIDDVADLENARAKFDDL